MQWVVLVMVVHPEEVDTEFAAACHFEAGKDGYSPAIFQNAIQPRLPGDCKAFDS